MGNRPINRRPFRRPPWRNKGAKGERGWLSGMTAGLDWNQIPVRGSATPFSPSLVTQVFLVDGAEMLDHEDNMKVVRTIGEIHLTPDGTQPDDVLVRMGILETEERTDFSTGVATVDYVSPSNLDDVDRSWMWLGTVYVPSRGTAGSDVYILPGQNRRIDIDTKSARRLKANDRLSLFIEARYVFRASDSPIAESGTWININLRHFCTF